MRLDLFLKASRLCLRRSLAQTICEAGRVSINGKPVKSAHTVKPNDEIVLRTRTKIIKVRVLCLPDARQVSRKDAAGFYKVLSEELVEDELGLTS